MAITDFGKAVNRIRSRSGNVFLFRSGATPAYVSLGTVRGITINTEAITSEADSLGRRKTLASNVTVSLTMQQTGVQELSNLQLLADPASETAWANGMTLVITESPTSAQALIDATYTGRKFTFVNALPEVTLNLDFDGETEGTIVLELNGRIPVSQLNNFGTTGTITFDA
jgi:hypothetical protein